MPRGLRDPVMQHCKHSGIPIVWDQSTYVSAGRGEMWEEQARFGYRCGIAVAMHLPYGRHFFLGVDRDRPLPRNREKMTRLVEAFALFAFRAEAAASEALLANSRDEIDLAPLTPRELEVLLWTAEGKTAWEVGMVLGISERTAAIHANNATHKLGCVSKHQAALKALRRGLIGRSADIAQSRSPSHRPPTR